MQQLCDLPAKVSLVQIGCQLLPPQRAEGGGEGHFRGGGEAVFGLAPGTGLEEKEEEKKRFWLKVKLIQHTDLLIFFSIVSLKIFYIFLM